MLAVASAAVGAAAALLLQDSDDPDNPSETATQVSVVTPTEPDAQQSQTTASNQSSHTTSDADQPPATDTTPEQHQQSQSQSRQTETPNQDQSPSAEPEQAEQEDQAEQPEQEAAQPEAQSDQSEPVEQADPEPRLVASITPDLLTQGEAFTLTVETDLATAVAATIGTRSWNLIEAEPGLWWVIIAIPRDSDTGSTDVVIDLYGDGGAWLRSITSSFVVLASAAPFEEVVLGGSGIVADPAQVQHDHDVRFVHNVSVSGPARWQGPWILPAQGEVTGVFGSKRSYDGVPSDGWHHGHDIAADHGDPIVAPAAGTIVWTGELAIHGNGVIIDHGAGVYSGYWHMSLIAVRETMEVAPGDWLGNIGTTGLSTGPHLHWEVIIQGIDVDPVQWLGEDQPPLPPAALGPE